MESRKPGFYPEPTIMCLSNGNYLLVRDVYLVSKHLDEPLYIEAPFEFSPSIPTLCRVFVPVNSRVIIMSLPHDWLFQKQPEGVTMKIANAVGNEVLINRGEKARNRLRAYYALQVFGFIAWNENKKELELNAAT